MCGILGIVAAPGEHVGVSTADVLAMRDAMRARGPDASGLFSRRNVVFAHRRLAIRDIAGGTQPWLADDQQCVLVYNGEVYNDGELRYELAGEGARFRTRCDTEVVMAAYQRWGKACPERLCGMFAFGIYDFHDDSLLLVRDRFGIKPLFLTELNGTLLFASSVAALIRHPRFVKSPHFPAISHYLTTFRTTLGRETVFAGIWQLLPGEILEWRDGRIRIERYWALPQGEDANLEYEDTVRELETGLKQAVSIRLASDVPVGAFLSGGVDSSTLVCCIREATSRPMLGQCGGGETNEPSDFNYARHCAAHAGFDYAEVRLDPQDYYDCWQWMLDEYATPLSTPSDVILYALSRVMKKSVGVVLGGEGADELLCGYAVQHWAGHDFDRQEQLWRGRWPVTGGAARLFRSSLTRQYGRDRFESPTDHYFALNSLIPSCAKPHLFQTWAWAQADEDRGMRACYERLFAECDGETTARKHAAILHRVNLEGLLARLDSATMLAGLEARVPYTDHRLVERMFRVPERFKIGVSLYEQAPYLASGELEHRGSLESKRVLRTLADRLMPSRLARRKKASFPTPVASWLSGAWHERVRGILLASPFGREIFRPEAIRELAENGAKAGMWLWPLVNVLAWGDRQFSNSQASR